jgi:hypothetical protein
MARTFPLTALAFAKTIKSAGRFGASSAVALFILFQFCHQANGFRLLAIIEECQMPFAGLHKMADHGHPVAAFSTPAAAAAAPINPTLMQLLA